MLADEPQPLGKYLGDPATGGPLNQIGGFVFRVTMGVGADIAIENAGITLVRGSPHGIADTISRAAAQHSAESIRRIHLQ